MQVPPGHMVQQVVDQTGTLLHVILSPDPMAMGPGPQPAAPGQPTPLPGSALPGGGSATPSGSSSGTIGGNNNNGGASSGGTSTPASAPPSTGNNGGSTTPQPQPQFVPMTLQYVSTKHMVVSIRHDLDNSLLMNLFVKTICFLQKLIRLIKILTEVITKKYQYIIR